VTPPASHAGAPRTSRRDFLKTSAAAAATAATYLSSVPAVHAGGNDVVRVGLIGCGSERGGRGRGAAENCVKAGPNVQLVAMADLFPDHLEYTRKVFQRDLGDKFAVKDDACFTGWNAYQQLLERKDVDVVILATPPAFRPLHLKAAVAAGKHVFCEKPVAVDAPGCRAVMEACNEAKQKGLSLVSGLCWRYDRAMRETMKQVHDGAIGELVTLQCTYNTHGLWHVGRKPEWSDVEWQLRNWLYFTWLSGDHNVEQHIHSLDKMAWAMKDEYPVKAVGLGGRQVRTDPKYGNIFDHHAVVYEYKNGVRLFSSCRQQDGTALDVSDNLVGTRGVCHIDAIKGLGSIRPHEGGSPWRSGKGEDMYQQEHNELIASIRNGKPINNGEYMTKSTLMAIMGRMATYTGQVITWEMAWNSKENLAPAKYEFGPMSVPAVARPGVTKFA
jgi:predicted dehydrogenase